MRLLLATLAIVLLAHSVTSLTFKLPVSQVICFSDELPALTHIRFSWNITDETPSLDQASTKQLSLQLYLPNGEMHNDGPTVYSETTGALDFETQAAGVHKICVEDQWVNAHYARPMPDRMLSFAFLHGVDIIDYKNVARREHLKPMQLELRRSQDLVDEVLKDYDYMRQREEAHRDTNESTHDRVNWFTVFSICSLLASGIWQLYYLQRFFVQKKLI